MELPFQDENQQAINLPLASFWARFGALLLDSFLISLVTVLVFTVAGIPLITTPDDLTNQLSSQLVNTFIAWIYYAGFESSRLQATIGKQLFGIFVTDENGHRISFGRATGRFFAKLLSGLLLLVGYIMAAFTARRQALHDKLAGTLVFRHL
ncbi:RDD family protein [Pontibacter liquoris]|uniref:RDD family protein n=1 Tax=Pontibacter liquoris TaxID=2905677 RepID=UPI001FA7E8DF|nr:RDD family protein [Pontibacter liquoris]